MTPIRFRLLAPKKLLPIVEIRKMPFAGNRWRAICAACESDVRPETGAMTEALYGTGKATAYQTVCRKCAERWVDGTSRQRRKAVAQ